MVRERRNSFTLVELLIVLGLLALFAVTILITMNPGKAGKEARMLKRKKDLSTLQGALESYSATKGQYPSTSGRGNSGWMGICGNYNEGGTITDRGPNGYIPNLAPEFIPVLPHMPGENTSITTPRGASGPGSTCYLYISDGAEYALLAHWGLEIPVLSGDPYYDNQRSNYSLKITSSEDVRNNW